MSRSFGFQQSVSQQFYPGFIEVADFMKLGGPDELTEIWKDRTLTCNGHWAVLGRDARAEILCASQSCVYEGKVKLAVCLVLSAGE